MATPLLHYILNARYITNRGTAESLPPMTFGVSARIVAGPGEAAGYPSALEFDGSTTPGLLNLSSISSSISRTRFHFRIVFSPGSSIRLRDTIAHCNLVPFMVALNATRAESSDANPRASVQNLATGEKWIRSFYGTVVTPGTWYTLDLIYDNDALALFVNRNLISVEAFPNGTLAPATGPYLSVGGPLTSTGGGDSPTNFCGKIAAFYLYSAVFSAEVEDMFRPVRSNPWWFITRKANVMAGIGRDIGERRGAWDYSSAMARYLVPYDRGAIIYHTGDSEAFGLRGAIWECFDRRRIAEPTYEGRLGPLLSDEVGTVVLPGGRNNFTSAAIFTHPVHGTHTVWAGILTSYDEAGEAAHTGWPVEDQKTVTGPHDSHGQMQTMSEGAWFIPDVRGTRFLIGAIWNEYQATGGAAKWGVIITSVHELAGVTPRVEFAKTAYSEWYAFQTDGQMRARVVDGHILEKYHDMGGRTGVLGLPITSTMAVPGSTDGRKAICAFERGNIVWLGSREQTFVVTGFRIRINQIFTDSYPSDGTTPWDYNDLYFYVTIKRNGEVIMDKMRYPNTGQWDETEDITPNITLPLVLRPKMDDDITLVVDVWDYDSLLSGEDDNLFRWTKHLNAANAWGMGEKGRILESWWPSTDPAPGVDEGVVAEILPLST